MGGEAGHVNVTIWGGLQWLAGGGEGGVAVMAETIWIIAAERGGGGGG